MTFSIQFLLTRPPSPRSTCLIPHMYPSSRLWLRSSMAGVGCRRSTPVVVTSQGWSSSSTTAVFRDVTFSRWPPLLSSFSVTSYFLRRSPSQLFLASLLHLGILCHCLLAPSCISLGHVHDEITASPVLASPSDLTCFENFDPQITALLHFKRLDIRFVQ